MNTEIEKLRDDAGNVHDVPVVVTAQGNKIQTGGDYRQIMESFNYLVFNLGIVRVKYYDQGAFRYQKMFLVWNGAPVSLDLLVGSTSDANPTLFYGKQTDETVDSAYPVTLSAVSGSASGISEVVSVPVVDEVVVNNMYAANLSITSSSNVVYQDSVVQVKNALKPQHTFTPYGIFPTAQPGYQANGNFLSTLPDFVDYINFQGLGLVTLSYQDPSNWTITKNVGVGYTGDGGVTATGYYLGGIPRVQFVTVTPQESVQVVIDPLIDDWLAQYLSYLGTPTASLKPTGTWVGFVVSRCVLMPDGALYTDSLTYPPQFMGDTFTANPMGWQYFPLNEISCDVPGIARVRYMINSYTAEADFNMEVKVNVGGESLGTVGWYDYATVGSKSQIVGGFPDSFKYIEDTFNYVVVKLGIVRVKYSHGGVFKYERLFLVWEGDPLTGSQLNGLVINTYGYGQVDAYQLYTKRLTASSAMTFPAQAVYENRRGNTSGGLSANIGGMYLTVPVIEDITVTNLYSQSPTVSTSAYVSRVGAKVKVHDVLWGNGYTYPVARGYETIQDLATLPDFFDYQDFGLGVVSVIVYQLNNPGTVWFINNYIVWESASGDVSEISSWALNWDPHTDFGPVGTPIGTPAGVGVFGQPYPDYRTFRCKVVERVEVSVTATPDNYYAYSVSGSTTHVTGGSSLTVSGILYTDGSQGPFLTPAPDVIR